MAFGKYAEKVGRRAGQEMDRLRDSVYGIPPFNSVAKMQLISMLFLCWIQLAAFYDFFGMPLGAMHKVENWIWTMLAYACFQIVIYWMIGQTQLSKEANDLENDHWSPFSHSLLLSFVYGVLGCVLAFGTCTFLEHSELRQALDDRADSGIASKSGAAQFAVLYWYIVLMFYIAGSLCVDFSFFVVYSRHFNQLVKIFRKKNNTGYAYATSG